MQQRMEVIVTSKERYWERRKAGLRGQGDFRFSDRGFSTGRNATVGLKFPGAKALRKNTKRARKMRGE